MFHSGVAISGNFPTAGVGSTTSKKMQRVIARGSSPPAGAEGTADGETTKGNIELPMTLNASIGLSRRLTSNPISASAFHVQSRAMLNCSATIHWLVISAADENSNEPRSAASEHFIAADVPKMTRFPG